MSVNIRCNTCRHVIPIKILARLFALFRIVMIEPACRNPFRHPKLIFFFENSERFFQKYGVVRHLINIVYHKLGIGRLAAF